jgi:GTP-binding protein
MKFIDEVRISVAAGKGGDGCCSFLRLKFMPFGGPDGGDGGDGGSVFLVADASVNTLVAYHFNRSYQATAGSNGRKRNCYGKSGADLLLQVPLGTMVYDHNTNELIADLTVIGQQVCVAQGGKHGLGNAHFKTSTNRSPQRIILGSPGEQRQLRLELKVLADVGLLGLPNAGKSTLLRSISAAQPKIADYPFTTLDPQLGVVRMASDASFVVADLPGLIAGAAQGAGLGFRFLKHLSRNKLLWHVIDLLPVDGSDPVANYQVIYNELADYSPELLAKKQWLVFNKADLLQPSVALKIAQKIVAQLNWRDQYFLISSVTKLGIQELLTASLAYLSAPLA